MSAAPEQAIMGDLSYWSANSLFKQPSHSRHRRAVVRASLSQSSYISRTQAHLFFKKMELLLRAVCILAFIPLSIQLCPLWPGFKARLWDSKSGTQHRFLANPRRCCCMTWYGIQFGRRLPPSLLKPVSAAQLRLSSSGHFTSQTFFNFSSSITQLQSSRYREEEKFPWNLCFCIYQTLSATRSNLLLILVPNKPGLAPPATSISLTNLSTDISDIFPLLPV